MAFLEEYTLLDELGQGGFATVYKVRHNRLGYIRAIRVLNAVIAHGEEDETYQKFLRECRLLLRLGNGNHPNIVHIYQPLLKAQRAIVEMDYVDGKNLYNYLKEKSFFVPVEDVIKLLTDIGSALAYCHEDIYKFCMDKEEDGLKDDPDDGSKVLLDSMTKDRLVEKYRVIHNDIHSGNIIRRGNGSYVLLDFGLAIEGDSVVRSSRRKNGAPEFKAPEKWDNDAVLTTQSDIYSFGVVLYEYLAGRVPFPFDKKNSNAIEAEYLLGKAHKTQTPEPICGLRKIAFESSHPGETYEKDYPDWLESLIMRCLAKEPEKRFKDGKELDAFVQECVEADSRPSEVSALEKENAGLRNQLELLQNASEKNNGKVDELTRDFQEKLKNVSGQLVAAARERDVLKDQLNELKDKGYSGVKKVWKILAVVFIVVSLTLSAVVAGKVFDSTLPDGTIPVTIDGEGEYVSLTYDDIKQIIEERDSLKTKIGGLQDEVTVRNLNRINSLQRQLSEKDSRISELEKQVESLKSENRNAAVNNDKTIDQLRSQIKDLSRQIDEKDKLVNILNGQ